MKKIYENIGTDIPPLSEFIPSVPEGGEMVKAMMCAVWDDPRMWPATGRTAYLVTVPMKNPNEIRCNNCAFRYRCNLLAGMPDRWMDEEEEYKVDFDMIPEPRRTNDNGCYWMYRVVNVESDPEEVI